MRQVGNRSLWIGPVGDTLDPRALLAAGVEAVVELSDSEPFAELPRELIRCRFPLSDGGSNPSWLLRLAAQTVATLLQAGIPTLVCCRSGLSRSPSVAAAGLALAERIPFDQALGVGCGMVPQTCRRLCWRKFATRLAVERVLIKGHQFSLGNPACPRRYCWWLAQPIFDWIPPADGCRFLTAEKAASIVPVKPAL
jgi:hypothetical protein